MSAPDQKPTTLVLRYHSLGDVILTTGIVRQLYQRTKSPIDVVTESRYLPIFHGLPGAGRLWERKELESAASGGTPPNFSEVIDLQATAGSRWLARQLGPGKTLKRHGLSRRWIVLWGDRFPRPRVPHAISRYAKAAGLPIPDRGVVPPADLAPEVHSTSSDQSAALDALPALADRTRPIAALLIGASRQSKAYPIDRMAEVARGLEARGWAIWWIVDPQVASPAPPPVGLSVALDLAPLKAALAWADVAICGDCGPMHLASAVGTPVVAVFGSSVAGFGFTPAGPGDQVLENEEVACRPCGVHGRDRCWLGHWRCLRSIEPARVIERVEAMRPSTAIPLGRSNP